MVPVWHGNEKRSLKNTERFTFFHLKFLFDCKTHKRLDNWNCKLVQSHSCFKRSIARRKAEIIILPLLMLSCYFKSAAWVFTDDFFPICAPQNLLVKWFENNRTRLALAVSLVRRKESVVKILFCKPILMQHEMCIRNKISLAVKEEKTRDILAVNKSREMWGEEQERKGNKTFFDVGTWNFLVASRK